MVAIVPPYSDNFRRTDRGQEFSGIESDWVNAASAEAFDVAIGIFRRSEKDSGNDVAAGGGFDEAVLRLAI